MGFGDAFKKATEQIVERSPITKKGAGVAGRFATRTGSLANPMTPFSATLLATAPGGRSGRTQRTIAGAFSPVLTAGEALSSSRGQENLSTKAREFFRGKDEKPPPVGAKPGQGAGNIGAKQRARARAIAAARGRFGIGDTIATSPLGLTGDGAALGRKRLIGE